MSFLVREGVGMSVRSLLMDEWICVAEDDLKAACKLSVGYRA